MSLFFASLSLSTCSRVSGRSASEESGTDRPLFTHRLALLPPSQAFRSPPPTSLQRRQRALVFADLHPISLSLSLSTSSANSDHRRTHINDEPPAFPICPRFLAQIPLVHRYRRHTASSVSRQHRRQRLYHEGPHRLVLHSSQIAKVSRLIESSVSIPVDRQ